jgi:2'-5' RNA ligase
LIRSFLAIELPEAIRKRIEEIQTDLKSSNSDVRWVSPEKIHLTLKFFGNIEESRVDTITKSIEPLVGGTPLFSLEVRGMGAFPNIKNPRVLWMGLIDEKQVLVALQKQLESTLETIGFQVEDRPFRPHLTLGRMNSGRGKDELIGRIQKYKEERFGDVEVKRLVLFKSDLRPTGPIYTPLRELKLGQGTKSKFRTLCVLGVEI